MNLIYLFIFFFVFNENDFLLTLQQSKMLFIFEIIEEVEIKFEETLQQN